MDLRELSKDLVRSWWLLALGLILGVAGSGLATSLQTPKYTSSSQLFVSTTDTTSSSDAFQGGQFSQQRVASYSQLIVGDEIAERVASRLNLEVSAATLQNRVSASAVQDTVLLSVSVTDEDPERAQQIGEAYNSEFIALVSELEAPSLVSASPVRVTVVDSPELPAQPSSPNLVQNLAFGAVLGLAAGVILAVIRGRLPRKVTGVRQAQLVTGAPVLGLLPPVAGGRGRGPEELAKSQHAYRRIAEAVQLVDVDNPPAVQMLTSPTSREDEPLIAFQYARTLVLSERRVVLVEANRRQAGVAKTLGLRTRQGLVDLVSGAAGMNELMHEVEPGLTVLPLGNPASESNDWLSSDRMATVIKDMRNEFDVVLVDAPDILSGKGVIGLTSLVDGVVIIIRSGQTSEDQLRKSGTTIEDAGGRLLGVVLAGASRKARSNVANET